MALEVIRNLSVPELPRTLNEKLGLEWTNRWDDVTTPSKLSHGGVIRTRPPNQRHDAAEDHPHILVIR
jgi:hypothetical protein